MKRLNTIFAAILLMMVVSGGGKQSLSDVITVDVMASYPKKELILQDFVDVEYIALETSDEFNCQQGIVLAVGKNVILVINYRGDGNIFVFDRNGKALRKINRMGNGREEYLGISEIALDEDNGEIFINDRYSRRIMVYDLYGAFNRSFWCEGSAIYTNLNNFDKENLICYDASHVEGMKESSFFIISKKDGSIVKDIQFSFNKKNIPGLGVQGGRVYISATAPIILPNNDSWILTEHSVDTVFRLLPDYSIVPFMIRTPSIQTSIDAQISLFLETITERYLFMTTTMYNYDPVSRVVGGRRTIAHLAYDKQENRIYEYTVYNNDFSTKTPFVMTYTFPFALYNTVINNEIAFWQRLDAYNLIEAHEKGQLNGKLKEIAAKLEKGSNPVIMLLKHK